MDFLTQIGLILGILLYGFILQRHIPARFHFVANLAAASLAVACGVGLGLSADEMGIGLGYIPRGILIAVIASVGIMVGTLLVASLPPLRRYFIAVKHMEPNEVAYETAVRIPLSTALTEEVLFRGVLLGVLLSYNGLITSIIISSAVFGLWHVIPGLRQLQQQRGHANSPRNEKLLYASGTVAVTAVAGAFFGWLRMLAGSIIAPWLMHWSINSSAMLASAMIQKLGQRSVTGRKG